MIAVGAAVIAPRAAFAQSQQGRLPRIAYLSGRSGLPDPSREAILQGLSELGYVDGKNIRFEHHYFGNRMDQVPVDIPRLVETTDIIVSATFILIEAVVKVTKTVPIVFLSNQDPVAAGMVASLARPGGNITGISRLTHTLSGKRLELLKEAIPGFARAAVLQDANEKMSADSHQHYAAAARTLKIELTPLLVRRPNPDLEGAFRAALKERAGALVVIRNTLLLGHSRPIADLAIRHRLPSMCEGSEFIDAGGLISYAPNDFENFKRTAYFMDKILKGAKAGDLPIEQPTKFELIINLKTAKALGIKIPQSVVVRADKVIA